MRMNFLNHSLAMAAWVVAILGLCVGAPPVAAAALPPILDQVSADPAVLIIVPNLQKLSDKVAQLGQTLGVENNPKMSDLLGSIKEETGFIEGVQDDGALAIVFPDINEAIEQDRDPAVVVLVPTDDYAALVGNFGGDPTQPVTELTMKRGRRGYAKKIEGYAVFGDRKAKEAVTVYQPGGAAQQIAQQTGTLGTRCLTSSDFTLVVNVTAMSAKLQGLLVEAMGQIRQEFEAEKDDPQFQQFAPFVACAINAYEQAAHALVRDTMSCVLGFDLTEQGFGATQAVQFRPDSYLATLFPGGGGAADQLAKIKDQPYLMAESADFRGVALNQIIDDLVNAFPDDQVGQEGDGDGAKLMGQVMALLKDTADLVRPMKGGAMVYLVPTQEAMGMGQSIFRGVSIYQTKDAEGYSEKFAKVFEGYSNFFVAMQELADEEQPQMTFTSSYTKDVVQVDGVSVDQFQTQIQYPPEVMQEMGPMMPFMMMMGATGQTGYVATSGDHVIMTTHTDPQLIKQALGSIKNRGGLGSVGPIQKLRAQALPQESIFEFYLSVGGIVETANMFMAMMMGQQLPIEVPADLPPVAWAMSAQDSGLVGRLYVPVSVMEFSKNTFEQSMGVMMGGGGGPNGQQNSGRRRSGEGGPPPAPN